MPITTGGISSFGFAFEQGSTWGTAVAVGAGDGVRIRSENITGGFAPLPRAHIGDAYGEAPDIGAESWRGPVAGDAYYGGNVVKLLSRVFGTAGAPTDNTGSYTHSLVMTDLLTKFDTIVVGKRASQKGWEYASAMINSVTIRGSGNGRVEWEAEYICAALDRDSSTNTTTQTDAVTVPTLHRAVLFSDATFRMNTQSGGALTSTTDDKLIAGFELTINRNLSEDLLSQANYVAQPAEENPIDITLALDLRSYDSETYIDLWDGQDLPTEQKADLVFSSGVTPASGLELTWTFQFPRMVVMETPQAPVSGPGRVPHRVTFKCLEASSAPTGMSGITKPVRFTAETTDSSAYLT